MTTKAIWMWPAIAIGAAVAVFALLASNPEKSWLPVAGILAPLVLLWLVRHRLQIVPLSPVWLIAIVLAAVGAFGYMLAEDLAGLSGGGMVMYIQPEDLAATAYIYASAVAAFALGATITTLLRGRRPRVKLAAIEVSNKTRGWMLVIAIVPVLMIFAALGSALIDRDIYLAGGLGLRELYGLGQQLATATIAIVGYVLVSGTRGQRILSGVLLLVYFAMLFSMGSRRIALLPIVLVLGMLMAKPTRVWLKLAIAGGLAALLLPVPLFLRGSQTHGLIPYLDAVQAYDIGDVDWLTTLNNVLISFPTTAMTAFHTAPLPIEYLFISLNPLPGGMAGWYEISRSMSLNAWTPYSTLGELWNYGPWVAFAVWAGIGVLATILDGHVQKLWEAGLPFISLAIIGLAAVFALQALQYNVRQSSRMILYALIVSIVGLVFVALRDGARRKREERERAALTRRAPLPSLSVR